MATDLRNPDISVASGPARISLDDKFVATHGSVYLSGSQALVRVPIDQARWDQAAGLNTAGFISGYRGSPLGGYDMALWQAEKHLKANRIHFQPGVNEELAATSVSGSQQVPLLAKPRYEGVFGIWYGKGPGVDRAGDALKHGSYAGSHPKGGVLALCGDDHAARSSSVAHQSDHAMIHFGIPILHPANIQEILDYGLMGFALSRFSGCWISLKCVGETIDGSASIRVDPARFNPLIPGDFELPPGGLGIRYEIAILKQEARLYELRHRAAQAFARANGLDHVKLGHGQGRKRLGIVTTGKSYLDVIEALAGLGIGERQAEALGIAVFKVGMVYPLEPEAIRTFASGCEELLVIEEKRGVIEPQLAGLLFNLPAGSRPRLIGKADETGRPFVSEVGELRPEQLVRYIVARYRGLTDDAEVVRRLEELAGQRDGNEQATVAEIIRQPTFCAGCPHSTSTRLPEGSSAMAGIGCHGMAALMPDRGIVGSCQMGGEGAPWIGQAPFVDTKHMFQNLGDGTYFHSGILALRACVAAQMNITYKILVNGAVGMTGGQTIEGERFEGEVTAPHVAQQTQAEGVRRIAVVSDDIEKYGDRSHFPAIATFHDRTELDKVQRELREWNGVSVLIYDQSCATERRRLRKRGKVPAADMRLYIEPNVCEGCGDCGVQSTCIALEPLETELGRKRQINQSVCNQDYSCLKGFCPSFVTITGGKPRSGSGKRDGVAEISLGLPEPVLPQFDGVFSVLVTGIGGNGVVTIGAILAMAAHIEGKSCTVLDMSGFAQRNGAVMSHLRIGHGDESAFTARIPSHAADLVLGCDAIVTASADSMRTMAPERTAAVVNNFVAPTSTFAANPELNLGFGRLRDVIARQIGQGRLFSVEATGIAMRALGDAIGANMFIVGVAWQRGLIPLRRESIEAAIFTNGAAKEMNRQAFELGRLSAAEPERLAALAGKAVETKPVAEQTLPEIVASRSVLLTAYQDERLAQRYRALVARVDAAEQAIGRSGWAAAVAHVYAKLLSYKDEYEVGRLYAAPAFRKRLEETFEGDLEISFNLAPPLLAKRDPATGRLKKMRFGARTMMLFKLLAAMKGLRGTPLDIFGYGAHRRVERALIGEYEALTEQLLGKLSPATHDQIVSIAKMYGSVRGYDVVKEESIERVRKSVSDALSLLDKGAEPPLALAGVARESDLVGSAD